MPKVLKIVLYSLGSLMLVAYFTWAVILPDERKDKVSSGVIVDIKDINERHFVSSSDIEKSLIKNDLLPNGELLQEISTSDIEEVVSSNPMIRRTECYKSNKGNVCINIWQRQPKLRVAGAENYFIDVNKKKMLVGPTTASYVPVLTGKVNLESAQNELFDFVDYLENNNYWKNEIEQINITENDEIELVTATNKYIVQLGSLENYEQKLNKLRIFYENGFAKMGWLPYREIDLRYYGQVIGRR